MTTPLHFTALIVFCFFFLLVTLTGFWAARWRRPAEGLESLEEWGLAGRQFGTLITWFLVGGDLYTAYTVIAVPALLFGTGAFGFFAVPYATIAYPYMMLVLPRLWLVSHRHGYVTFADFVRGRFGSRSLTLAIAVTGVLALLPYIALQLVGMQAAIAAIGIKGEWPLIAAFVILAAYTYSSGLRAPAAIAVVKDVMLYLMVGAAVIVIPMKLGGYAHIFASASVALHTHTPPGNILLMPQQYLGYSTLVIGSAIALMLYPHTATGMLSAHSANVVRRNAALLPSYSFLLGMVALLGYMALAAGIRPVAGDTNSAIPQLFLKMFPEWFAGFCLAAIGIGALVPAAIMSIAAANLYTRNIHCLLVKTPLTPKAEASIAKSVSLVIKGGALVFILNGSAAYAIQLQLLGGIWIGQIFPAVVIGVFTRWLHPRALLAGWFVGMFAGTAMAHATRMKSPVYPLALFGHVYPIYAAIPALLLNLAVCVLVTLALHWAGVNRGTDATVAEDYLDYADSTI
jgi:SSS family solute:Na+ symporter